MKFLKQIYHFLGGVYFAITLIAAVAVLTIAGTLIESKTDSHRYAAYFTYDHALFSLLLGGFFINILFSALRRWPFKKHHVPFLITHLGLLMILGGSLIKSYFGVQGSMGILEGGAKDEIFTSGTYVVQVERRDKSSTPLSYEIKQSLLRGYYLQGPSTPDFQVELVDFVPHSYERLQTWVKKDKGFILGMKPFPVYEWDGQAELPISAHQAEWNIYAFKTARRPELVQAVYAEGLTLNITDRLTQQVLFQGSLKEAIVKAAVRLTDLDDFRLLLSLDQGTAVVHLTGPDSLLNLYESKTFLGQPPCAVDLKRRPALLFIEDENQDVYVYAFDAHGRMHDQEFRSSSLSPIIVYDEGFGGYCVQAEIPVAKNGSRTELEKSQHNRLLGQLKEGLTDHPHLAPPLVCLQASVPDSQEFASCLEQFLAHWNQHAGWLYPEHVPLPDHLKPAFESLTFSEREQKACQWVSRVFQSIEPSLLNSDNLKELLQRMGWPILIQEEMDDLSTLTLLTQQIVAASEFLPPLEPTSETFSSTEKAHLLTAYLRAYGIHWSTIALPPLVDQELHLLETPITAARRGLIPSKKIEDNLPLVKLKVRKGDRIEVVTLTYDRHASGFRWPILNGEYALRFQPKFESIPYRIRLRQARRINYANSTQPYSYESDLLIIDKRTEDRVEKTISMNNVHETTDGYRFYLANIFPANETAVKQVQLVVNHDPAKYWLTYPGVLSLTLGIFLLFWMRPYKR